MTHEDYSSIFSAVILLLSDASYHETQVNQYGNAEKKETKPNIILIYFDIDEMKRTIWACRLELLSR